MKQTQHPKVSFFPMPLQDELLDSFIYRYHHLAGDSTPNITIRKLFGIACCLVPRMLMSRIDHLYARLPSDLFINADDLLDKHTVLPAFSRIYDNSKVTKLRDSSYGGITLGMGAPYRYRFHPKVIHESPQCCPLCIKSDIENVGVSYWRRGHRLNGAAVCHVHGCDLIDVCPYCGYRLCNPNKMDLPTSSCQNCKKRFLPTYSYPAAVRELAKLAQDALDRTVTATDLVQFGKAVSIAADHDTYTICQTAKLLYGEDYLQATQTLQVASDPDWLSGSFTPLFKGETSGPRLLNFATFAGLLMTVHILFGSWQNLDRAMDLHAKAA